MRTITAMNDLFDDDTICVSWHLRRLLRVSLNIIESLSQRLLLLLVCLFHIVSYYLKYCDTCRRVNNVPLRARTSRSLWKTTSWMFSLPLWLLFLTTVTGSSHHSLTCSIGEPAFDVDCGAFHGSNHECRNNCKVKCSDGTGQMVLKISWLTNLQDQNIQNSFTSFNMFTWHLLLIYLICYIGVYMRGRVEIFESELFRRHCRQSNWQGPGGILGLIDDHLHLKGLFTIFLFSVRSHILNSFFFLLAKC